ncbi:hypothetical protein HMPREF9442_03028 [Paraprevotella xylaniphila YIT 11841]|uniref:Uncharacterized protein n=1 Tax=Paraprevotella xylaniphila YIT 11841 TaxID=762982 RepID=F3QXU0_9BACT|nr:hypothetical protein HMPREF9442_03028 [Paraprevotella xylaniphila YIT 11841]
MQEEALYATVQPFLACQIKRKRCLLGLKSSHTVTKRHSLQAHPTSSALRKINFF